MRSVGHLLGPGGELIILGVPGEAGRGPPLSRLSGVQLRPGDVRSAATGQPNLRGQDSLSMLHNFHPPEF